jgi:hypothetical protein
MLKIWLFDFEFYVPKVVEKLYLYLKSIDFSVIMDWFNSTCLKKHTNFIPG